MSPFGQEPTKPNYDETKVPSYDLPNPLIDNAGNLVGRDEWLAYRRGEILRLFEEAVYGRTPQKNLSVRPEMVDHDPQALNGRATRKQIAAYFGETEYRLDILLYIPNQPKKPVAGFVGLNFNGNHTVLNDPAIIIQDGDENGRGSQASRWQIDKLVDRGYALATIHRDQIAPDNPDIHFAKGIYPLFYTEGQMKPKPMEWGAIGVWAWALSRLLDYLELDARVDAQRIGVMGHSRLGKAALWAGAQDTRFALVISNNSGCGGAALYRRCFGERIHHMIQPFGHWFCANHHAYQHREQDLPVDQHMLLSLIAPRPLYVASATADLWADPKGEFLSAKKAGEVYKLFNKPTLSPYNMPQPDQPLHTTIGYHLRTGEHDVTAYDWQHYLKFADHNSPNED
ncbi:MAG: acetylxylan esterase [Chloroflexota bacterium]